MAHNKTLTELKWFKWALWGPIGAAAFVATVIGVADFTSENLQVCFTSTCVNDAISRLKLPIAIASLAFPLVALVASHHRSVQTAAQIARTDKQIETTESKNAFENRLKHFELFQKYTETVAVENKIKIEDFSLLYRDIFHKNDFEFFSPFVISDGDHHFYNVISNRYGEEILNFFDFFSSSLHVILNNVKEGCKDNSGSEISFLFSRLYVSYYMGLNVEGDDFKKVFSDSYSHAVIYDSLLDLFISMSSFSFKGSRVRRGSNIIKITSEKYWNSENFIFGLEIYGRNNLEHIGFKVDDVLENCREGLNMRLESCKSKNDASVE